MIDKDIILHRAVRARIVTLSLANNDITEIHGEWKLLTTITTATLIYWHQTVEFRLWNYCRKTVYAKIH